MEGHPDLPEEGIEKRFYEQTEVGQEGKITNQVWGQPITSLQTWNPITPWGQPIPSLHLYNTPPHTAQNLSCSAPVAAIVVVNAAAAAPSKQRDLG